MASSGKGRRVFKKKTVYPWEGANPLVIKGYNVRFPEPLMEKLRLVVKNTTYKSTQEFIMAQVEPAIEEELEKLIGGA